MTTIVDGGVMSRKKDPTSHGCCDGGEGPEPRKAAPLEAVKGKETDSLRSLQKEPAPLTPWFEAREALFRLLTSSSVRGEICVVLSHRVCGNLLQQPEELIHRVHALHTHAHTGEGGTWAAGQESTGASAQLGCSSTSAG